MVLVASIAAFLEALDLDRVGDTQADELLREGLEIAGRCAGHHDRLSLLDDVHARDRAAAVEADQQIELLAGIAD